MVAEVQPPALDEDMTTVAIWAARHSVEGAAELLNAVHAIFECVGGDDPLFEGEDALADPTYNLHDALLSLGHLRRKLSRRLEPNHADYDTL